MFAFLFLLYASPHSKQFGVVVFLWMRVCVYVVFYDVGVFLLILKGSPHSCTLGWDVMGSS